MFLIGRNEQGSSKSIVAMLRGIADGLSEAFFIAIIDAAIRDVAYNITTKFVQTVVFVDNQLGANFGSVIFETITAGSVFDVRVNVGIIPKKCGLDTLCAKGVNAIYATRCTTSVH